MTDIIVRLTAAEARTLDAAAQEIIDQKEGRGGIGYAVADLPTLGGALKKLQAAAEVLH